MLNVGFDNMIIWSCNNFWNHWSFGVRRVEILLHVILNYSLRLVLGAVYDISSLIINHHLLFFVQGFNRSLLNLEISVCRLILFLSLRWVKILLINDHRRWRHSIQNIPIHRGLNLIDINLILIQLLVSSWLSWRFSIFNGCVIILMFVSLGRQRL